MFSFFSNLLSQNTIVIEKSDIGFIPPNISEIIAFLLRFLFVIGGLAALVFLVLGGLSWITSSGEKDNVEKAQKKIQAAVIGLIVIFAVLAIVVMMEKIVIPDQRGGAGACGLGISEPICLPVLYKQ